MKNQLLDRAGRGLQQLRLKGARIRAVTLTLGPKADNAKAGRYLQRLRSWLAKPRLHRGKFRSFRHINYFWTKEFQPQTGQLHFHMLIDAYIPIGILRKAWKWATYGTSSIVFITKTWGDIQNPAGYMTKYMAKEISQNEMFRPHERRYGFSRGWNSPFLLHSYRAWLKLLPGEVTEYKFTLIPSPPPKPFDHRELLQKCREEWDRIKERKALIKDLFEID
jgi:hypothetical protein